MAHKRKKKKAKVIPLKRKLSPKNYIIKVARKLPIHEVRITSGFQELGTANMLVSRRKKNGDLVVGFYKIDSFCVGLLDSEYFIFDEGEYLEFLDEMIQHYDIDWPTVDTTLGFNYIYGAIEFGEDNGFTAHKSFGVTQYILDNVDDVDYIDMEFGKNGRPLYSMFGPYNHEKNLNILDKAIGPENYDILEDQDFELPEDYDKFDIDMSVEEFIKETLNEEEEYNFTSYASGLLIINDIYEEKLDQLKTEYLQDPLIIIKSIEEYLSNDEIIESVEEEQALIFWKPKIENYIIHQGQDFIFVQAMIESFRQQLDEDDKDYELVILSFLLHLSGPEKFDLALPLVGNLCCEAETEEEMKTELRLLIQSFDEDVLMPEEAHGLDYLQLIIFQYIWYYEREFGEISFDKLEWKILLEDED